MPNIDICNKCYSEAKAINRLRIAEDDQGWECPLAPTVLNGMVLKKEHPPRGCPKLFEHAIAMTKKT